MMVGSRFYLYFPVVKYYIIRTIQTIRLASTVCIILYLFAFPARKIPQQHAIIGLASMGYIVLYLFVLICMLSPFRTCIYLCSFVLVCTYLYLYFVFCIFQLICMIGACPTSAIANSS